VLKQTAMNTKPLLPLCFAILVIACRKGDCPPEEMPNDPGPPVADISAVRLKDMSVESLPSPNYHFVYNDSGYITQVVYASGAAFYDISYAGKKVSKIETNKEVPFDINKDVIEYEYSNNDPAVIKVIDKNGNLYRKCSLVFAAAHQLQKITWELKQGVSFVKEQTLEFSYYTDANLKEIAYHDFPVGGMADRTYKEWFENYDNKANVDGFTWLHTNLHHPVLLPSVKLQLNNPGKDIRTGSNTLTYEANYTYTYDASGRPVLKTGPVKFVDPQGHPGQFISTTTFSYY
jgi:hypothetical protein